MIDSRAKNTKGKFYKDQFPVMKPGDYYLKLRPDWSAFCNKSPVLKQLTVRVATSKAKVAVKYMPQKEMKPILAAEAKKVKAAKARAEKKAILKKADGKATIAFNGGNKECAWTHNWLTNGKYTIPQVAALAKKKGAVYFAYSKKLSDFS